MMCSALLMALLLSTAPPLGIGIAARERTLTITWRGLVPRDVRWWDRYPRFVTTSRTA
jgi:hypothetical protein